MKCAKEYIELERIFQNKTLQENFNEKQKCLKSPANKGVFVAYTFWLCPSKKTHRIFGKYYTRHFMLAQ